MAWIKISDNLEVYSIREDFTELVDWILYFVTTFTPYFMIAIGLILIIVVFFALARRFELFSNDLKRMR